MSSNPTSGNFASVAEAQDHSTPHLLPETGYLRLAQIIGRPARNGRPAILALIPVARSTWWAGVKSGRYPQSAHLGPEHHHVADRRHTGAD